MSNRSNKFLQPGAKNPQISKGSIFFQNSRYLNFFVLINNRVEFFRQDLTRKTYMLVEGWEKVLLFWSLNRHPYGPKAPKKLKLISTTSQSEALHYEKVFSIDEINFDAPSKA